MSETIGQQLKQAREARNLTLKKVTQETHIQTHLLEAMEADDFESLPSPVQARAFLRIYAEFLGLSLDDLIARQRTGINGSPSASHPEEQIPGQNQKLEDSRDNATAVESADEPREEKSPLILNRIKRLFLHDQQNITQPQTSTAPVEPIEQVESVGTDVEEPALNNAEEIISAGPDSSNHPESQVIFSRIGEALRQRRETISLTLDEIENHTHVRKHYLRALEIGDFDHLPSSVQARGMLNNYAHFLDLDVDAILMQYAEGLQIKRLERQPAQVEKKRNANGRSSSEPNIPTGIRRYFSLDVIFGVGLILTLFVIAIWGTSRVVELRTATTPQPSAQSISDILVASPEVGIATPTIPTEEIGVGVVIPTASSAVIVTLPATGQGPVKVIIIALGQAFVRVTVDGKIQFDGRITAGTAYPFDGNDQIEVLTGNGAAVSILFNESDLGPMGNIGEVVDRIYTADTILNPTATYTPTPTITPIPSITPRFSPTPSSSTTPLNPTATSPQP